MSGFNRTRAGLLVTVLLGCSLVLGVLPAQAVESLTTKIRVTVASDVVRDGYDGMSSAISAVIDDPDGYLSTPAQYTYETTFSMRQPDGTSSPVDLAGDLSRFRTDDGVETWMTYYGVDSIAAGEYALTTTIAVSRTDGTLLGTITDTTRFLVRDLPRLTLAITPKAALKGAPLAAVGTMGVADRALSLQFRSKGRQGWTTVANLRTDKAGRVRSTITATGSGTFRLLYAGDKTLTDGTASAAVSVTDPKACTGVRGCEIVKRIDVDGDGRFDQVGMVRSGKKLQFRVRTRTALLVRDDSVDEACSPRFWGSARVDSDRGNELVYLTCAGSGAAAFRVLDYAKGKLTWLNAPGADVDWHLVYSMNTFSGISHTSRGAAACITYSYGERPSAGRAYQATRVSYCETDTGWKRGKVTKFTVKSAKAVRKWSGWHVRGLPNNV